MKAREEEISAEELKEEKKRTGKGSIINTKQRTRENKEE
jgi:hypothetical protein